MADEQQTTASDDAGHPEPALLRDASPSPSIPAGAMFPSAEVERLVAAAELRGFERGKSAAWKAARETYKRKRDELIERVARETAALLRGEKGKEP